MMDISPLEIQKKNLANLYGVIIKKMSMNFWIDYCKTMRRFIKRTKI